MFVELNSDITDALFIVVHYMKLNLLLSMESLKDIHLSGSKKKNVFLENFFENVFVQ